MYLKTVNGARSAYACFVLNRPFFNSFSLHPSSNSQQTSTGDSSKAELSIKLALKVHCGHGICNAHHVHSNIHYVHTHEVHHIYGNVLLLLDGSPCWQCSGHLDHLRELWIIALFHWIQGFVNWFSCSTADMVSFEIVTGISSSFSLHFVTTVLCIIIYHMCPLGIVKTHQLGYQDCDVLQAMYSKELCPNQVTGAAK